MKIAKQYPLIGPVLAMGLLCASGAQASPPHARHAPGVVPDHRNAGLVRVVRESTRRFLRVSQAATAGYGPFLGCTSGDHAGAMGLHYVNGTLVGDGTLDASRPEALVYEPLPNGRMQLVAVEYVVIAEAWHATHPEPPMLMGQLFHYSGSPNRYGLPPHYALHVWAWKGNPNGAFAHWNPRVSCAAYAPVP